MQQLREYLKEKSKHFSSEHIHNEVVIITDQLQSMLYQFYSKQEAMKTSKSMDTPQN